MTALSRIELLKAAIDDSETSRKLLLAPTWDECVIVLEDFARTRGLRIVQL